MMVSTFQSFCDAVDDYRQNGAPGPWRDGQVAMNMLSVVRPEMVSLIRGSEFDCFDDNRTLIAFYGYVARHWDDEVDW
jgi:hypothetical protein